MMKSYNAVSRDQRPAKTRFGFRCPAMRRVLFVAAAWLAGSAGLRPVSAAENRPNILWLIVEDACPDFACYGNEAARTPNIDRFAREGRLYREAFATGCVCSPSRSAFMTGRYQTSF